MYLVKASREELACKKYRAIFLVKIGDILSDGEIHDGCAPNYGDW